MEVPPSVHRIDVTLPYGWEVIPTWQSLQPRESIAGLDQRRATGAEEQHLRGIRLQPVPRHHLGWCSWSTQTISTPGELQQVWAPVPGQHQRIRPDQQRDAWRLTQHDALSHDSVDAGEERFEECRGLAGLLCGVS